MNSYLLNWIPASMTTYHTSVSNCSKNDLNKMYKRNIKARPLNYCCRAKALLHILGVSL